MPGVPQGPFSFAQYYQFTNEPLVKSIYDSYIACADPFTHLTVTVYPSQKRPGKRIISLPTAQAVAVGTEPTGSVITDAADFEEGCFLYRDNLVIDEILLKDPMYVAGDPLPEQIKSYIQARTFDKTNCLFNNDHVTGDPNKMVGLKYRLTNPTQFGTNVACQIQATADLSDAGISAAGAGKLQRDLQMLMDHMGSPTGANIVFFLSPQAMRQLDLLFKNGSPGLGFKIVTDSFDRSVTQFKDAKLVSCGYQAPTVAGVQTAPIIPSNQDVNGWYSGDPLYNPASAAYTSIFAVRTGKNQFEPWQMAAPSLRKERVTGTRQWYVMFDETIGLFQPNTRAIGRIYGVKTNGIPGD